MVLKIKGIGKIQDSQIEMKGITVIAGENNTGKSTFGKVLYCMFNAFHNTKAAIRNERINDIRRIFDNTALFEFDSSIHKRLSIMLVDELRNKTIEKLSIDNIREIMMNTVFEYSNPQNLEANSDIDNIAVFIKRSLTVSDIDIQKIVITHYFENEFERRINHVNKPDSAGSVSLVIKGRNVDVTIRRNECDEFIDNVGIRHNAIYIDNPFVLDDIQLRNKEYSSSNFYRKYGSNINHRRNLINRLEKEHSENTVIEEVIINQKITGILSNINKITNGEFIEKKEDLMFIESGLKKPVPLFNVSAGLKTFLIIKRLLELGEIKERNILILDEPEIHLHPAWQLQFAEILVLLQKEFNLTILLTTHSPYFLNAIEVYSEAYEIKEQTNFYLAKSNGDTSDVREVTGTIDTIYKQLAMPFQELEDISYGD